MSLLTSPILPFLLYLILNLLFPSVCQSSCTLMATMPCPPVSYCQNSTYLTMPFNFTYNCDLALNLTANQVTIKGGIINANVNILADYVLFSGEISRLTAAQFNGNLTILYVGSVTFETTLTTYIMTILPVSSITNPTFNKTQVNTIVSFVNISDIYAKKLFIQANYINMTNGSVIQLGSNTCLYKVLTTQEIMKPTLSNLTQYIDQLLLLPINLVFFADQISITNNSQIFGTVIIIFAKNMTLIHSIINSSQLSCLPNMGLGKGLDAQVSNLKYCTSGASSAGYGMLSNPQCASYMQYFMFLTHSFPYLSKGPYLCSGSGGYGYRKQGAIQQCSGGGVIFIYASQQFYTQTSYVCSNGGQIFPEDQMNFISAGSGGTVFLYTGLLSGSASNFSAFGGYAFNNNGSGAGGVVKISYASINTTYQSIYVNVSAGYQPNAPDLPVQSHGIFYGVFCKPGQYSVYLSCLPCDYGSYGLLGYSSCQKCPPATDYLPNINKYLNGITNISQCFSEMKYSFVEIWIEPGYINWFIILLYALCLLGTFIIGLLIKKKYKKKLTVMQTQDFSLDDAKKDVDENRILTQSLKAQRHIKFQDLMYHIHRITLFGSNNPQCPWALPEFPPEQIKQYILREGFIDFSVKFNKVAQWTKMQKFLSNLTLLVYPIHWYYYDNVKKQKYKKLIALLEESKQFNLINNYDFEDKNMVTIKISKNADYTICYLDFMVYDRADTKYFSLNSPFIITISGQGNFLRPFYLEDQDVFFNTLFYIVNKAQEVREVKQSKDKLQKQEDEKNQLFANLIAQKKKQDNRNRLIDFLKMFNTISITLDLAAPLGSFILTLISLVDYIAVWNESYFKELGIQLDLILIISKIKKGSLVANQIHILTNKNPQMFSQFMKQNIPKMNRYEKYDLKLGLFVYNPDQQMNSPDRRSVVPPRYKRSWIATQAAPQDEQVEAPLPEIMEQELLIKHDSKKSKFIQQCVRFFNFIRYMLMTHRKLKFDKDMTKFFTVVVILFQCMLVFVWEFRFQVPYMFVNLLAPFAGVLWAVSGSYGIGKLFLILNAMALLDELVTLVGYLIIESHTFTTPQIVRLTLGSSITVVLKIMVVPLASKLLSVSKKLSTSKMFK